MKTNIGRIEKLQSAHLDNRQERTPKMTAWQKWFIHFGITAVSFVAPNFAANWAYRLFTTPRWKARHLRTDEVIEAAKISDFSFDNQQVKCYDWGETTAPIVLLAHGWESRGTALRMYVKPLLGLNFRVVAFDAIAHGDSTGKTNNLAKNAQTMAALIQSLGGVHAVIGHSFGCSSIVFALQFVNPKLRIDRLVFLAVPHSTKHIAKHYFDAFKIPARVRRLFIQKVEQLAQMPIEQIDVAKAYPSVNVGKLLLIHDEKDDVTSIKAAYNVVNVWQNAHLLVTEGYGHFRIAKNPDVIKRLVEFIAN
ncbi:MAG: alpha/beta hydrolase [Saprospiraceae bacterium]|nr:alpha/beta hydrolase [Saprospiraceae bacterium]